MRKFSSLDWYVISRIPASALYKQGVRQLLMILFITCFALFVSIPVSYTLAGTISRPIQSLCDCMDQAGAGNLNVPIPAFGEDEIGYLSHKFTNMLAQISSLIAQVTQVLLQS